MTRGFLIIAVNSSDVDYMSCAKALAISIKRTMPYAKIAVVNADGIADTNIFDYAIKLPYGDLDSSSKWKLSNDWQAYEASPFDSTIKLEADMYIPRSIEHWWDVLEQQDVVVSTTIRNFKGEISEVRVYRRFIDDNSLPDCYNAITYFKKSDTAKKFFDIVRDVFENWDLYKAALKCNPTEEVTTDWAYAIASHIMGVEKTTMCGFTEMSMTHMKQYINGTATENWTDSFIYEIFADQIRINTCPQIYPFHYHVKSFSDKILFQLKEN